MLEKQITWLPLGEAVRCTRSQLIKQELRALIKFALVGVANTLVGLSSIYLGKWLLDFGDVLANICGYAIGLALSFFLNRRWTFRHSGPVVPALTRFLAIFIVAYLTNLMTVLIFIKILEANSYLAQASGILPYTVIFFFGSRYIAFRPVAARVD
jgi:putative flippase GtrA